MKKKNPNYIFPVCTILSFFMITWMSCNSQPPAKEDTDKDDETEMAPQDQGGMLPTATQLITKKWEVDDYNISDQEGKSQEDGRINTVHQAMDYLFDLQVGDVLVVFDRSNEYVADGTWELAQDTSKLFISVNSEQRSLKVDHFEANRLALSWIETIDNTPMEIQLTLKPFMSE
jgi:hypothetical protein